MGLFSFIKKICWEGSRCFKCGTPLSPAKSGELFKRGWRSCTVRQCNRCGKLICERCSMFGLGMMHGCDCGGHEFIVFQMWVMD